MTLDQATTEVFINSFRHMLERVAYSLKGKPAHITVLREIKYAAALELDRIMREADAKKGEK